MPIILRAKISVCVCIQAIKKQAQTSCYLFLKSVLKVRTGSQSINSF